MKGSAPAPSKKKNAPQSAMPSTPQRGWLDRLADFWLHFGRFGWDILGVVLAVMALITLLGLLGLTGKPGDGKIINSWVGLLDRGFGWGAVTVVLFFILLSLLVFRRGSDNRPAMSLGQIIALELLPFWILALLSIFNGIDIERAFDGQDGGVIGWGMAYIFTAILPMGLAAVLLAILAVVCLYKGFGIDLLIRKWLADWESKNPQSAPVDLAVESDQPEQHTGKTSRPRHASDPSGEPVQAALFRRDERLPPTNLLMQDQTAHPDQEHIHETAVQIEQTLSEFGVPARVVGYRVGPTVTQYAVEPGFIDKPAADGSVQKQKVRVNQISTLSRDLALALSAERLRIEAPVPGRSYVGIEVPNLHSSAVRLRAVIESEQFQHLGSPLSIALGRDVSGLPVVGDLSRMPHILIAGTTGSGKSVCIAALTACLVMNNTPDDLRLAMLDPKMVELVRFNGLPHLLGKVETDIQRMLGVLRWALQEMDHRYRLLEEAHTRDLENYNRKMQRKKQPILPRIVVLIDELADLMMSAPDQTEHSLVRLAQMARATGIHLVLATQRPSTDVVTGLIKANFPARISFTVASAVDSRVILDSNGAETLLGRGDMLFLNPEVGSLQRVQGVMVTDPEIDRIISFWQKMSPPGEVVAPPWEDLLDDDAEPSDGLVDQAIKIVKTTQRASASLLQRKLRIGYPRAARLIDELEEMGVVGPNLGAGRERDVLLPSDEEDEEMVDDEPEQE